MSKAAVQQPTEKKTVVGNKTTELIIGSAANKFLSATTSFESMMDSYNKMKDEFDQTISDKTLMVVTLESKIVDLKQDLENKTTQNKIELKNQYDADKKAFVEAWLRENGYTMIYVNELSALKKELVDTKSDVENKIKVAVTAKEEILTESHKNEITTLKLTHEKDQAQNDAKISLMNEKIVFLTEQVDAWKTSADESRKASVEIAKAGQVTQNFSGNGK